MTESKRSSFNEFINHIKFGNINGVKKIFNVEYLDMEDELGKPIHHACQYGHIEIVKLLLQHKCDIETRDNTGMRALHFACKYGRFEIVKLLMEHKCNVEISYDWGRRPLDYACQYGHIEIVELLLEHKCSIEVSKDYENRPLHHACENGHLEIVKLLLENNCNIETGDYSGMRPLHYACENNNIDIVKLLLNNKCQIEVSDYMGMRPLHYACQNGHIEIVKLLLKRKCKIDVSNSKGMRPFHFACKSGHIEIVKLLLEHKCNIDISDDFKMPLPYNEAQNDSIEIIRLLLEKKCKIEDYYHDIVGITNNIKSQEIMDFLNSYITNPSMCGIAIAMSLKCQSGCSHSSCFISMSVEDLKKKSDFIGSGASGKVYKCSKFERSFALKIIRINDESKNIEKNIEAYKNILKHDNIVQYFGSITESLQMIIFMEYVDGDSLHDLIKDKGAIPHDTIAKYSRQILLGIAFLHQKKIIHRDIKPPNILFKSCGISLKLCDFGISRSLMTISTIRTQNANTVCGTPNYLAPEIVKNEPYSFPADIWAIGATIVDMLTGHPPFHNLNQFAVILKISQITTIDFTPDQPMSDNFKYFVNQMLQNEPAKRATAKQLLDSEFINSISSNYNL